MNGGKIALDTNQAIAVMNDQDDAGSWIATFKEVYLPVPVLGELIYGALNSSRVEANLQRVAQLASRCYILPISEKTAELYAHLRLELKQKGKPIPENDLWIAALCVEHAVPLATDDAHFTYLSILQVVQR